MPRLTASAFRDLAIWMVGFGLAIGLVFPPFVVALGLPATQVITLGFVAACLGAGAIAGLVNYGLARLVVGSRLRLLAARMRYVDESIRAATYTDDWSGCDPETCRIPIDSNDEFGHSAAAFNGLVDALWRSHHVEGSSRAFNDLLASHIELAPLAEQALANLLRETGAEAGAVLVDHDGELRIGAASGLHEPDRLLASSQVAGAIRSGAIVNLEIPEEAAIEATVTTFRPAAVLVAPLALKGIPVGALVLASSKPIEADTQRLVEALRPGFAVALNNALTHERIQRLATLDPLTGLYNRRFGMLRLREEFARAIRAGIPLGVALFDIDHFKTVNDTYGHVTGDRVLVRVAQAARRALREGDVLIRYGGEEFMVVMVGASREDAEQISERLRRAVAETVVQDGDQSVRVTISVGATSYPTIAVERDDDLVRTADEALYAAKDAGRDRVVFADRIPAAA